MAKKKAEEPYELGMTTRKAENFYEWYSELLQKAEVVDIRFRAKGFDVYMPTAMMVIRELERLMEEQLELKGHRPVMFPVLIPESYLKMESEHIRGFEKEVFWVTHGGTKELEERLCLRPTSETAMYPLYSLWIRSHLQLPLKFYQAVNVYRYETKMTRPLIRPREFRWIEAHTAQRTAEEAEAQVKEDMETFRTVVSESLCIPFLLFKRPEWDKFPGAENTYAFETILPDGKSLQIGTTHDLGQKFAKVFDIKYLDEKGKKQHVHQTCFGPGISRITGALVGIHGDDRGLIIPPAVAPIQAVIIPIYTAQTKAKVFEKCGQLLGWLSEGDFRVHLDDREQHTPGFKFHEWELKGVPVRIEVGPKDMEKGEVSIVRRDFLERTSIPEAKLEEHLYEVLDSVSFQLKKRADMLMKVSDAKDLAEIGKRLKEGGFVRIAFCMTEKCADMLKEKAKAEILGTLFGKKEEAEGRCAVCGEKARAIAYAAVTY